MLRRPETCSGSAGLVRKPGVVLLMTDAGRGAICAELGTCNSDLQLIRILHCSCCFGFVVVSGSDVEKRRRRHQGTRLKAEPATSLVRSFLGTTGARLHKNQIHE